ncbi:hypothetical protein KSE_60960 [Kitasatospora setae KM-6054]|uniref:Uncharacterized protein n=1 Tax=Kitasatospora setae (strain ATCC 33774 / DSM 43861 / JCM 3304 / KCC A-0304 / NBRC 14216 / KM-6054) TaxID=452652 RepID=E4N128_KITSK|nr:hypothetical protein KSE_60960 [Kitasatospora setae KM-6054]
MEGGGAGEGAETAGAAEEAGTAYEAEPTVAPAARRRLPGLLKVAGLVLAIVAALFVAAYFSRDTPAAAKAGDCAHNAGSEEKPDVSLVDCGSADAEFTVLKVVHGADEKECETEPALVATYVETRRSSVLVLCLGEHG